MNIAKLAIKRPIFITSIVLLSVLSGWVLLSRISVDMFPNVNIPVVSVTIAYPGAGPEEIENLVTKPVEEELSSLSGLKRVTSTNQEGFSMIIAEFFLETDIKWAEQEVRTRISRAKKNLPDSINEPVILRFDPSDQPVVRLAVFADLPPGKLFDLADKTIKSRIEQINDVGAVRISGGVKREIQVEIDRNKLNDNLLSVSGVGRQLQSYGSNVPVGKHETGDREISYRSIGQFESLKQIANSIVSFTGDWGSGILLKNIGTVQDGTQDENSIGELWAPIEEKSTEKPKGFFAGLFSKKKKTEKVEHVNKPTLFLDVFKQSDKNTVKVADGVIHQVAQINLTIKDREGHPAIRIVRDGSHPIRLNIEDVTQSIIIGIILAVLVVYLFLGNVRSTLITGLALPNSILGAFVLIYLMDFSINIMTLLALSLSVGLLVDDAIVVRENIFRKLESGMKPFKAAEVGTTEVMLAVIATTLTVVAVFFPIGFLKGMVGQFFKQFGLTVVFAMLVSLFDALAVAPLLSAYFAGHVDEKTNFVIEKFKQFQDWLDNVYAKVVNISVTRPLYVILGTFLVVAISLGSLKFVKNTFMPPNDMGEFMVNIQMPPGTSLEGTHKVIVEIRDKIKNIPEVDMIATTTGTSEGQSDVANLAVTLLPYKERSRNTTQIKEEVRTALKDYAYANASVGDYSPVGGGIRYPFNLYIKGEDLNLVADYTLKLAERLKKIPDITEVSADYRTGKPEFQVRFDAQKMQALGVVPGTAGSELRYHIAGGVVGKLHENGEEYDIRLRLKESQRNLQAAYKDTKVPNMQNKMIPLTAVSSPVISTGPDKILRQNRSRVILINANVAKGGAIGNATSRAKEIIAKEFPPPAGVDYEFVGQSEDMRELMENIMLAFGLALLFIYLVLSSLYESFITPVTILFAIPPAISGAFLGLAITGEMMNIFSMIGLILLMGLVTKNSILLVDYAVEGIKSGMTRAEAIAHAGKVRLRPILMTSFAMIAGTLPLALGIGEVAKMRKSMGVAIVGGLIVSTLITLIVVPAIFSYVDSFREWVEKKFRSSDAEEEHLLATGQFPSGNSEKKQIPSGKKNKPKNR
ncbi:MAG: efflux RND transporter permease subunit [Spirochaetia bacterium]|nr:efflux RND transporter permease subunit [Spirochaetia bacterium]